MARVSDKMFVEFSCVAREGVLRICGRNYCKEGAGAAKKGRGLQNLERRLLLLYPGRHRFSAACSDHVFTAELTVKLK